LYLLFKVKGDLLSAAFVHPHSAALSSQTGPRFSLGRSRLSSHTWTLTYAARSPGLPSKWSSSL